MTKIKQQKTNYSSLGARLKGARLKSEMSRAAIARKLQLKTSDIVNIETGLPEAWEGVYQRGYIESYARIVGEKIKFEALPPLTSKIISPLVKPINQTSLVISQLLVAGLALIVVLGVIGYVALQVFVLISPPPLHLDEPTDGFVSSSASVKIRGKTAENTDVSINGISILTEPDGSFTSQVPLKRGVNDLTVTATNRLTKQTSINRTVIANYQIDPINF